MGIEISQTTIDGLDVGPVPLRVYQGADCSQSPPVLLYFHGGAFSPTGFGACPLAEHFAESGVIVVMPDYTTPRGSAFPKPLEVGFSLFGYLARKRAGFGNRKSLLLIGGLEAGGNLAAAVALKARDYAAGELDGQVLASPLLDPFMGSASLRNSASAEMQHRWQEGWSDYLSAGICHPYAAPCTCSRLAGATPALVLTSQDDPLRDEATGYADKLREAGVRVQLDVVPAGLGWPAVYGDPLHAAQAWKPAITDQLSTFFQTLGQH